MGRLSDQTKLVEEIKRKLNKSEGALSRDILVTTQTRQCNGQNDRGSLAHSAVQNTVQYRIIELLVEV